MPTAPRTAPRTARATARAELTRAILESASGQLAETGPAALSVRAVARELGMASSAVYRYFPSRDALLTALIVEAYDDLGASVEAAEAAVRRGDLRGRWRAVSHAVRDWASLHPHQYALTYGSPVPGYAAPDDTVEPALRVTRVLMTIVRDAHGAGRSPTAGPAKVSAAEKAALAPLSQFVGPAVPPAYLVRGLMAWHTLFGHVSLELFGHMYRGVLDYDAHFTTVTDQLAADLGLT